MFAADGTSRSDPRLVRCLRRAVWIRASAPRAFAGVLGGAFDPDRAIVDSYTNILTVKLFARARDEDEFVREAGTTTPRVPAPDPDGDGLHLHA